MQPFSALPPRRSAVELARAIFLFAALAGCTPTPARQAEETTVAKIWGDCVYAAVVRLDDGHSDPTSIAIGVAPACGPQYLAWTELMVGDAITEKAQAYMREWMRTNEIKTITSAVLIHRSKQAGSQPVR